jgi:hypothetical protein
MADLSDDDSGEVEVLSARRRAYHAIRAEVASAYFRFYKKHPEKIHEPEAKESLDAIMRLMARIYGVLDRYEIEDLPKNRRRDDVQEAETSPIDL